MISDGGAPEREPLGYVAQVHKSLTDGFQWLGVQREVFMGVTFLMAFVTISMVKHCPWRWYWSLLMGLAVWAAIVWTIRRVERWDSQWGEVLIHRLFDRDTDHA